MGTILKGNSIGSDFSNRVQRRELMIWRTQMQAKVQGKVQLKDSICLE
jgi:hypothetical protein